MAHITGGGLTDNVPRVLPDVARRAHQARLLAGAADLPAIFEQGGVERDEMLRVFNMGIGMVLIAARRGSRARRPSTSPQIGQKFYFIGNVVKGIGKVVYDTPPSGFASWIE